LALCYGSALAEVVAVADRREVVEGNIYYFLFVRVVLVISDCSANCSCVNRLLMRVDNIGRRILFIEQTFLPDMVVVLAGVVVINKLWSCLSRKLFFQMVDCFPLDDVGVGRKSLLLSVIEHGWLVVNILLSITLHHLRLLSFRLLILNVLWSLNLLAFEYDDLLAAIHCLHVGLPPCYFLLAIDHSYRWLHTSCS